MITSLTNEKVKYVRSLYRRTVRQRERSFVIEGVRLVEEALESAATLTLVIYDPESLLGTERGRSLLERIEKTRAEAYAATAKVVESIAGTVSPQGVVATGPFLSWRMPELGKGDLALVVDGLQDPGNLGTILRSAEAGGVRGVLLTRESVDLYNPKVMRAAMGAHFRLPAFPDLGWEAIRGCLGGAEQVLFAEAGAALPYYEVDWCRPSGLIVGGETRGVSPEARGLADRAVAVPMAGRAESLNAAVAASVIMFEALRQRRQRCQCG